MIDEKQLTKDCEGFLLVIRDDRGERVKSEGKDFHTEEVTFRREDLDEGWELVRGRENFKATRL